MRCTRGGKGNKFRGRVSKLARWRAEIQNEGKTIAGEASSVSKLIDEGSVATLSSPIEWIVCGGVAGVAGGEWSGIEIFKN